MKEVKSKKGFSIVSMITSELVILYLVLYIGSIISLSSDADNLILTRYIPVGIVSILITYFFIRFGAMRCFKSEKEDFWKQIIIVPIVVTIAIFLYGMYSVNSNVSKINKQYETYGGIYSSFMKNYQDEYQEIMKEAKKTARNSWIITSLVYLVCSGVTTFCLKNKIDKFLKYDDVYESDEFMLQKNTSQILTGKDEENANEDSNNNENRENDAAQNIKWDL